MKIYILNAVLLTAFIATPLAATPSARASFDRLLRNQIEEIWGKGRIDLIDETYATTVVDHMPIPGQPRGLPAMKQVVRDFRNGLPDIRMTLHKTLSKGDYGVDFWTMTATQSGPLFGAPPTGKPIRISGIDMVHVDKGKIVDLWHVEEILQLRQQMELDPVTFGKPDAGPTVLAIEKEPYNPGANAAVPPDALLNSTERRNLGIARRHIEEIWAKGNVALAYQLYAPDVVDHNPAPNQRPGINGIVDVLGWLRQSVPDLRMSIKRYLVDGDYAVDRWVMCGTHTGAPLMGIAARGKTFKINGMDVIRIREDGRISDIWHAEDFDSMIAQIKG